VSPTPPLPIELQSKPRTVPRGVPGPAMANFFLALFLVIGTGFAVAAYFGSLDMDFGTGTPAGTGRVTAVDTVIIKGKSRTKKAEITYDVGGTSHSCRVRWSLGGNVKVGDEQPYWNDGSSPILDTCAKEKRKTATGMLIGFSIASFFELLLGVIMSTVFRRRARLYTQGDGAVGTITACRKWGRGLLVSYEVTLPVEVRGRSFLEYRRIGGQYRERPPEPGTPVYVVYDPEKTFRSAAWGLP
jgi:hypothetical protein